MQAHLYSRTLQRHVAEEQASFPVSPSIVSFLVVASHPVGSASHPIGAASYPIGAASHGVAPLSIDE